MTTAEHVAGHPLRDWKVTTGYRVMIKVGWTAMGLAVYGAAVAVVVGIDAGWWITAGMAAFALAIGAFIPQPVPRELITGGRNHIESPEPVEH